MPIAMSSSLQKCYGKIIVMKRNGQDSASFELSDPSYLFGRAERCDIRIQLACINEEHCRVFPEPQGRFAFVQNLSSSGISINGGEIKDHKEHALNNGDVITIVERSFRYENPFWQAPTVSHDGDVILKSPIKQATPAKEPTLFREQTPVKLQSPFKRESSQSPLKQSTPIAMLSSPQKAQLLAQQSSAKQELLSTPIKITEAAALGSPSKTPQKPATPAKSQMNITPVKTATPTMSGASPRPQTPFAISSPSKSFTISNIPADQLACGQQLSLFNVCADDQVGYCPPQSPAREFSVTATPKSLAENGQPSPAKLTPMKNASSMTPQNMTPPSQTRDIGKIMPGSISTPITNNSQKTPILEKPSFGSSGYTALVGTSSKVGSVPTATTPHSSSSPQKAQLAFQKTKSPVFEHFKGVIDHEISASPKLSPRIKLIACATDDGAINSPNRIEVNFANEPVYIYGDDLLQQGDLTMVLDPIEPEDVDQMDQYLETTKEDQQIATAPELSPDQQGVQDEYQLIPDIEQPLEPTMHLEEQETTEVVKAEDRSSFGITIEQNEQVVVAEEVLVDQERVVIVDMHLPDTENVDEIMIEHAQGSTDHPPAGEYFTGWEANVEVRGQNDSIEELPIDSIVKESMMNEEPSSFGGQTKDIAEEMPATEEEDPQTPRRSARLQKLIGTPSKLSETERPSTTKRSARKMTKTEMPAEMKEHDIPIVQQVDDSLKEELQAKNEQETASARRKSTRTPKAPMSASKKAKTVSVVRTTIKALSSEAGENSPSIQALRRSARSKNSQGTEDEEDKENNMANSVGSKKGGRGLKRTSAESAVASEPDPPVRKSARTRVGK